jgi:hypothetical protein
MLAFPCIQAIFDSSNNYLLAAETQLHLVNHITLIKLNMNLTLLDIGHFVIIFNKKLYLLILKQDQKCFWNFEYLTNFRVFVDLKSL